jgi:3-deoxy-7-phosphoheptulonate synthase
MLFLNKEANRILMVNSTFYPTDDLRIKWTKVVTPPVLLEKELPTTENASSTVYHAREEIRSILSGKDHRLLVIVGPCSIHDTAAARDYATLLKGAIAEFSDELRIVMRVYFEKPRTTVGWKGLLNDPYLNQSFEINEGLRLARHLLLDLAEMCVPAGTEFLDMISPQYVAGLVSWGSVGARTTESQVHRQLVSGLSCPVGFKNATSGDAEIVFDAILSAAQSHTFLGHTKDGQSAIFATTGNPDCHVVLRGGRMRTNYAADSVAKVSSQLEVAGLPPRVMIDCSHANSRKDHTRQGAVCSDVAGQVASGDRRIIGVVLESNLVAGAQFVFPIRLYNGSQKVVYGPIRVQVTAIGGDMKSNAILNASNGEKGVGAVFDYSKALRDLTGLAPGGITEPMPWRIDYDDWSVGQFTIDLKITGHVAE